MGVPTVIAKTYLKNKKKFETYHYGAHSLQYLLLFAPFFWLTSQIVLVHIFCTKFFPLRIDLTPFWETG